jgi:hypothetical protein
MRRVFCARALDDRHNEISDEAKAFANKFVGKVVSVFSNLPKPVEWPAFYNHDLGITSIPENIKQWAALGVVG